MAILFRYHRYSPHSVARVPQNQPQLPEYLSDFLSAYVVRLF